MEVLDQDRIGIRFQILENIEYYIEESVYYRSFSEDMPNAKRMVLYNYINDSGKLQLQ